MMVTFPHLGPLGLVLAQFFRYLDIPFISAPDNGRAALEKGMTISPEEMCVPFKFMAGNFMEAYELGADTAVMVATCGPCRLGEYGQMLSEVLSKAGCRYDWVLLDSPAAIGGKEFIRRFRVLLEGRDVSSARIVKGIETSLELVRRIDSLRTKAGKKAGYLKEPYNAVRLLHETEKQLKMAEDFNGCFEIIKAMDRRLDKLEIHKSADPVKILVAGEIYTSIEKEANGRLEETLMKLGCSVTRHIDLSWWIRHTFMDALLPEKAAAQLGTKDGIPCTVGGYGRETVAKILKSHDFDGVIKIMPAGCMPEIVTKAFCEKLQQEEHYRILHLIYDEMSGRAGYETRIEAFVDMLERRKHVLAGD